MDDEKLSRILKAAGDTSRRRILTMLVQEGPLRVTELAAHFDISLNSVSKHIKVLEEAGLVTRRTVGRDHHIAADLGPRGDGYRIEGAGPDPEVARAYHRPQLESLAAAGVDLACALTMTSLEESIGIVRACGDVGLPVIVSPTVETDGRLPDGRSLGDFVQSLDAATGAAPLFYMVNCAHPTHLRPALDSARAAGASWLERFRGFRANASARSHAELDESTELDRGDVSRLAQEIEAMRRDFDLWVVGGCCGTDHAHLRAIASA